MLDIPHSDPVATIKNKFAQLSPRRQEIIREVFERPGDFVLLSVRASADLLNTDSAFLLRAVQQLGFGSYAEFKRYLHELSLENATSLERMREVNGKPADIGNVLNASLDRSIQSLIALRNTFDAERMRRVAKRIHGARKTLILAGDLASSLADYLDYQLTVLGLPVLTPEGSGRSIHAIRTANERDVVLAISFRRGLRSTIESVKEARGKGAYCIGITNTSISPIATFTDEYFVVGVEGESLRSSYVAPMALADALIAACANVKRGRALKILSEASEEQKHGYRWYTE